MARFFVRHGTGLVFPHKDGGGFNIMLQVFPLDGKIVCREITAEDEQQTGTVTPPAVIAARPAGWHRPREPLNGRPAFRHRRDQVRSVKFYNIELAHLADGRVYVSMLATTVDDEEPQILTQEIACESVATIEDALAVIRQGAARACHAP